MYYFVVGADGGRYGPADIDTLVQWTIEGRVIGSTILMERGTDKQLRADSITAVAAALRRRGGGRPAVVVERTEPVAAEVPTMPRAGAPREFGCVPPPPDGGQVPPVPPAIVVMPYAPGLFGPKSKLVAGLLGIFLGGFGVHRFYLGYTGIGLIQLLLTICTCGVASLWGFVEGIVCLCGGMRDADGRELGD